AVTLLPSGQVLVVGGCLPTCNKPLASAEVYNPRTGTWTPVGNLHVARSHHTATLLPNGQVLVSGGFGDNGIPLASAELYTSLALQVAPMTALGNQAVTVT